jgi:hypothetical protein
MAIKDTLLSSVQNLAKESQAIVARQDESLFKIKGLTATLWAVVAALGVERGEEDLLLLAFFAVLGLWFVAATFRGVQKRYVRCSAELHSFLCDATALNALENTATLPDTLPRSLGGNESFWRKVGLVLRGAISPTVMAFYGFFAVISLALYAADL